MKKKTTFLKTLLVAAGLLAGVNGAWAAIGDVTTNADIDFSNDVTDGAISGTVNSITLGGSNTAKGSNGDGNLILGNGTNSVVIPSAQYAGKRDKVTISFDLAFGKLNKSYVFFNAKDKDGNAIFNVSYDAYNDKFSANTLDISSGDWYHGYNTVLWNRKATLTIEIDYASATVKTTVYNNYNKATATHSTSLANTNPVVTFNVGSDCTNDGRRCEFDNLLIKTTEGDYTVATAGYKVKYVCEEVEIKEAVDREGDVGTAISLFASDKATFDSDDKTKRFIYVSDDSGSKTIEDDGSTVVTVTFREAEKYGYTISSSYNGTSLPFTQSTAYVWEDETSVTIQCPKYYNVNGTLVVAPLGSNGEPQKSFTITEDGFVGNIEYTSTGKTDIYLYSEAEDLEDTELTVSDNTGANDRVSCGKLAYGNTGKLVTLPAGKYIFTLGAWGGAGSPWTYVVKAGDKEIINSSCSQNTLKLEESNEFTLNGTTDITITATNTNKTRGIDLIYVQKTGDAELPASVPVKVTSAGYATYCSEYDLDLSGVTAYTATVADKTVTFTQNTGKVVAGTGLLIKAAAGTVNIPVVSDGGASAVADNALIGVLADTEVAAGSFVLMKASEGVGFYKTNNAFTVGANTAYIAALPDAAKSFIGFDDVTGIESLKAEKNVANGQWFNLAGQRVAQPTKGLYIVNGKKVIVK